MLGIYLHFLTSAALIVSVLGAPLEPLEFAATTTHANILPSVTNGGGQFFVQTTTGGGAQATAGATGTGNCPTTSTGTPKCYRYDSDFPPESEWMSLDCMISHGRSDMVTFSNDGPDEADNAIAAVQSVAGKAGIDPRVAFAVMMQESSGKVRPIVGDWGLSYGLFQVQLPGVPLCTKYPKNQCPMDIITKQVENGIYGHNGTNTPPKAPGLAYWMQAEGGDVGRAVRGYNTGSVPNPSDLTDAKGTRSYASDIANRLVGGLLGAQHQYTCPDF